MDLNKFKTYGGSYMRRTDLKPWRPAGKVFKVSLDDTSAIKSLNLNARNYLTRINENSNVAAYKANSIIHRMIETVLDEE